MKNNLTYTELYHIIYKKIKKSWQKFKQMVKKEKKMKKQLILKGCSLAFTCLLLIASVFVGVSAAKQLNFNVGIRFSPDYLCKVEVKSSSSSEFITIFNNSQPSAVHESYIEKIENNTLHLNLPELQTAMGATLNFRITNYTQTTAISATIESKDAQNAVLNTSTIKKIAAHDPAAAASSAETTISLSSGSALSLTFAEGVDSYTLTLTISGGGMWSRINAYLSNENDERLKCVCSSGMLGGETFVCDFLGGEIYILEVVSGLFDIEGFTYKREEVFKYTHTYYGVKFTDNASATTYKVLEKE